VEHAYLVVYVPEQIALRCVAKKQTVLSLPVENLEKEHNSFGA